MMPEGAGDEEEVPKINGDVEEGEDIRIMHHISSIQLKIIILIKL